MKLVILDCDGTIVDSQNAIVEAMAHAFGSLGLSPPPRSRTLSIVGLSLPEAFRILAADADEATQAGLAVHYKNAFVHLKRDPAHHEPLFPGAREAIEALSRRGDVRLAIATGKSRRGVDRLVAREGWEGLFASVQTADDNPSKPHPAMILNALAEAGAAPSATVMVGDTTFDIEMARAAGVGAAGVAWGYHHPRELRQAGADAVIESYPGLAGTLDTLFAAMEQVA